MGYYCPACDKYHPPKYNCPHFVASGKNPLEDVKLPDDFLETTQEFDVKGSLDDTQEFDKLPPINGDDMAVSGN